MMMINTPWTVRTSTCKHWEISLIWDQGLRLYQQSQGSRTTLHLLLISSTRTMDFYISILLLSLELTVRELERCSRSRPLCLSRGWSRIFLRLREKLTILRISSKRKPTLPYQVNLQSRTLAVLFPTSIHLGPLSERKFLIQAGTLLNFGWLSLNLLLLMSLMSWNVLRHMCNSVSNSFLRTTKMTLISRKRGNQDILNISRTLLVNPSQRHLTLKP